MEVSCPDGSKNDNDNDNDNKSEKKNLLTNCSNEKCDTYKDNNAIL